MENNKAFVCKIGNLTKIAGADRIVSADVLLTGVKITQVVTGIDTKDGILVVYFDSNMCVGSKVLEDYPDMAKYLGKNDRVKTIKLKNVISNGLVMEVEKFYRYFKSEKEAINKLKEGYDFTEINGVEICHKYVPALPSNNHNSGGKKRGKMKGIPSRLINGMFHFHFDTDQLLKNVNRVTPYDTISISRKIHGTSAICGNCLVKKSLNPIEYILKLVGVKINDKQYDYLYASRTRVKNEKMFNPFGIKENIWIQAGKKYFEAKLHKCETIYYEIVGYMPTGSFIQKGYDYGCKPGEYKIAVYRITFTNPDGIVFEYSWKSMKDRCIELQVPTVEEFYYGRAYDLYKDIPISALDWGRMFVESLKKDYLEKDCNDSLLPDKKPDEGIVVRIEGLDIKSYKLKSEKFTLQESKTRDEGTEDIEENQSIVTEEDNTTQNNG